jgi:hypothetical protein
MAQYMAIPKASNAIVEVALSTSAAKTLLQVKPVTQDLIVCAWHISIDASAAGAAVQVELIDVDVAATVTTLTAELWESPDLQAARAVGGTSATGYNASAEGTIGASRLLDAVDLPPLGGVYTHWFTRGERPRVTAGRFLRIRHQTAGAAGNAIVWILFDEN